MKDACLRAIGVALDGLGVGLCAFDGSDRTVAWNSTFLRFFPEHEGHIDVGEPFVDHLRRVVTFRLAADQLERLSDHVNEAAVRYRTQTHPYELDHRGDRLQVSTFDLSRGGRVRLWSSVGAETNVQDGRLRRKGRQKVDAFLVFECLADGVVVLDATDRIVWANQAFLRIYGVPSIEQAVGSTLQKLLLDAWKVSRQAEPVLESLRAISARSNGEPIELRLPPSRFIRISEHRSDSDGRGYFIHADVTKHRSQQEALTEAEDRYRLLAQYSNDIMLFVVDGVVTYASPAVTELLGWEPLAVLGRPVIQLCHAEDAVAATALLRSLRGKQEAAYQARALHRSGQYVWIEARARKLPTSIAGGGSRYVINARSIQVRKAMEDELRNAQLRLQDLAMTDGLTGLANRRRLDEALELELRRAQREGHSVALLVLDIDRFKNLNDAHGHQVGDAVLRRLGSILMQFHNRAGDLAARFGGEEFVLLLPGANEQQAVLVAERLRQTIQATDFEPPVDVSVTVSIGVASLPGANAVSPESLVGMADGALYEAKRGGRNRVVAA
jgi:diguanylate cyclase (GGDEF)-like protein/PAS domain S-box-containing protein